MSATPQDPRAIEAGAPNLALPAKIAELERRLADLERARALPGQAFPGQLTASGRATAPAGWKVANGASLLRADYAALFAAIGTTYGSADGAHFNIPDLSAAAPAGTTWMIYAGRA